MGCVANYVTRANLAVARGVVMTIIKFAAQMYVVQAATGFVVGFTIPWLQYFDIL
jgi:hypothetical protein